MAKAVFHQLKTSDTGKQLICFPYLGGHANSFYELANVLNNDTEIWACNPLGHGGCSEKPLETIQEVIKLYYEQIKRILKPNAIFFGHSMGGIVAYFLAEMLQRHEQIKLAGLVLSACNPPTENHRSISKLSDEALLEHLRTYQHSNMEILLDKTLMDFFIPALRADFKVLESSITLETNTLNLPSYLLWAENDAIVSLKSTIKWTQYFNIEPVLIPIKNAGHMFLVDNPSITATHLRKIINKHTNDAPIYVI